MAVDATAMAGRSLRFAAAKRRVRAGAAAAGGAVHRAGLRDGDVFAA